MTEPAIPPEFDELLQYRGWVRRLCRSLVANEAEAEDVEQDAWRRAIEAPPRHAGNLRSWLGAVVRSSASQRRRGESRRTRAHDRLAQGQQANSPEIGKQSGRTLEPEALAERRETFEALNRLLAELEEPYGRVVYLRFVDGLPPRAIAKQMQIPLATVKTRLHRGIALLRGRLHLEYGANWRNRCMVFTPSLGAMAATTFSTMLTSLQTVKGASIAAVLLLIPLSIVLAGPSNLPSGSEAVSTDFTSTEARDASGLGAPNPAAQIVGLELAQRIPVGLGEGEGATIQVRVIDGETREPVENAEVLVVDRAMLGDRYRAYMDKVNWTWPKPSPEALAEEFGERYRTDEDGRVLIGDYRFERLAMVTRTETHLGMHSVTTLLYGAAINEVESKLWPRQQLRVRVVDLKGAAVPDMIVHFASQSPWGPRWGSRASAQTNAQGEAWLRGLSGLVRGYADGTKFGVYAEISGASHHLVEIDPRALPTEALELRVPQTVPLEVLLPDEGRLPLARFHAIRMLSRPAGLDAPVVQANASREETIARGIFRNGKLRIQHVVPGFQGALQVRLGTSVREHFVQPFSIPEGARGLQSVVLEVPPAGNRVLIEMQDSSGEPLLAEQWTTFVTEVANQRESHDYLDTLADRPHIAVLEERPSFVRESPDQRIYTMSAHGRTAPGHYFLGATEFDAAFVAKQSGVQPFRIADQVLLSGKVVDQDGAPVPFAAISISDGMRRLAEGGRSGTNYDFQADENGRFEVRGEVPGLSVLDVSSGNAGFARFEFEPGQADREFQLFFLPRLQASVVVPEGLDVSKLGLKLVEHDNPEGQSALWVDARTGQIQMTGRSTGTVHLEVSDSLGGLIHASPTFELVPGKLTKPAFLNPLNLDATIHEHRVLVLGPSGQSIRDMTVHVAGSNRGLHGANPLGIFSVEDEIEVVIDAEGFAASKRTTVQGEAEIRLTAALQAKLILPGGVTLEKDGVKFVAHAVLEAEGDRPALERGVELNQGESSIKLPAPGKWKFTVRAQAKPKSGFISIGSPGSWGAVVQLASGENTFAEVSAEGGETEIRLELTQAAIDAAVGQLE